MKKKSRVTKNSFFAIIEVGEQMALIWQTNNDTHKRRNAAHIAVKKSAHLSKEYREAWFQ